MNDIITMLPTPQAQAAPQANMNTRRAGANGETDFSTHLVKAVERGAQPVTKSRKAEEAEPAEELAAYAAPIQVTNTPVNDTDTEGGTEISAIDAEVSAPDEDSAPVNVPFFNIAETLDIGGNDFKRVFELLGIEPPAEMTAAEAKEFPQTLVELIDAKLADYVEAAAGIETAAPVTAVIRASAIQEQLGMMRVRLLNSLTTNAAAETAADEIAEAVTETAVEAAPVLETPDGGETLSLPVEIEVNDVPLLENVRAKLSVYIASRDENFTASAEAAEIDAPGDVPGDSAETPVFTAEKAAEEKPGFAAREKETVTAVRDENTSDKKLETKTDRSVSHAPQAVTVRADRLETAEAPKAEAKVDTRVIIDQIVQSARMSAGNGTSQLEIQLRPAHLGKVSIVFTSGEEGVTAHIKASSDTTRAILNGGLGELMSGLKDMGVNMKNINVSEPEMSWDYTRGQGQHRFNGENREGANREQGKPRASVTRINSQRMTMLSQALYGTNALQPITDENVSVDFIA